MEDPSKLLPRDPTGSYLHLKLKRYANIQDLSMPYAKKTWKQYPQDAEVDISPASRSKCRQCHKTIEKGSIRMRLFLQCHKGCKISAYFHEKDCFWEYPEATKLESIDEIYHFDKLPAKSQELVMGNFQEFQKKQAVASENNDTHNENIKEDVDDEGVQANSKKTTNFPDKEDEGEEEDFTTKNPPTKRRKTKK